MYAIGNRKATNEADYMNKTIIIQRRKRGGGVIVRVNAPCNSKGLLGREL